MFWNLLVNIVFKPGFTSISYTMTILTCKSWKDTNTFLMSKIYWVKYFSLENYFPGKEINIIFENSNSIILFKRCNFSYHKLKNQITCSYQWFI